MSLFSRHFALRTLAFRPSGLPCLCCRPLQQAEQSDWADVPSAPSDWPELPGDAPQGKGRGVEVQTQTTPSKTRLNVAAKQYEPKVSTPAWGMGPHFGLF